jgi:S1-C subfamily serine protease
MGLMQLVRMAIPLAFWGLTVVGASAEDLQTIREDLERTLPRETLERLFGSHPLVFRSVPSRGSTIYRERVNGVVLIASTDKVGTGVLVSSQGDIVTNEHIVHLAHRARGQEWVAVWFKPSQGVRPAQANFVLGKVLQRSPRRDLAHIRLVQAPPPTATVVPMAAAVPDVGQEVFTIGHPKMYLWSFGQGVVAQIRADYQWKYSDGIVRNATTIQTQAPASPGNSGGPLLNEAGAIAGIVLGSASEANGAYFAVSVQHVRELLQATASP